MPDSPHTEAHLIIGYTPYHALIAESIIRQINGKTYCIFTKSWPRGEYTRACSWSNISRAAKIISLARAAAAIKRISKKEKNLSIYIPHPSHPLGNYAFFRLSNCKTYIYEDGIMNYYDAPSVQPSIARILLSYALLIPYKKYNGHLSGIDAGSPDGIYLTRPQLAVRNYDNTKKIQINPHTQSLPPAQKKLLFLSQDVRNRLTPKKTLALISWLKSLAEHEGLQILEKWHHDQNNSESGFEQVSQELQELPAESLVETLSPKIVVSFYSSALINIKQQHPEIRCISLAAHEIKIKINDKEKHLSDIFLEAGVECSHHEITPDSI